MTGIGKWVTGAADHVVDDELTLAERVEKIVASFTPCDDSQSEGFRPQERYLVVNAIASWISLQATRDKDVDSADRAGLLSGNIGAELVRLVEQFPSGLRSNVSTLVIVALFLMLLRGKTLKDPIGRLSKTLGRAMVDDLVGVSDVLPEFLRNGGAVVPLEDARALFLGDLSQRVWTGKFCVAEVSNALTITSELAVVHVRGAVNGAMAFMPVAH